jgi:DNA-binding response OmpR family regulator
MAAPHIISAGYDPTLMKSRSMLLRHAGFVVDEAFNIMGVLGLVKADSVDAVVLCHTIPGREQRWLISSVRKVHRSLPIICIKGNDYDSPTEDCLITANEPVDLLEVIRSAIRSPLPGNSCVN